MIRFCRSGTAAGPISTPRSPRATITASASARISSSASIASAFSILAITPAREPASLISLRRSRMSAAERTNDRATKSAPRPRATSRSSDVLPRQRRDRQRHAGQVHALVRGDRPADEHRAVHATLLDLLNLEADQAVVDQHVVAGAKHVADHGRADGKRAVDRVLGADERDVAAAFEDDGLGQLADPQLRPLEVGDQRRAAARSPPGRRGSARCGAPCPRASRGRS